MGCAIHPGKTRHARCPLKPYAAFPKAHKERVRLAGQLDAITTPASLRVPERAGLSMLLIQQHPQR